MTNTYWHEGVSLPSHKWTLLAYAMRQNRKGTALQRPDWALAHTLKHYASFLK